MQLIRVKVASLLFALLTRLRLHGLEDVPIALAKKQQGVFCWERLDASGNYGCR
jgi:hypothetical protein